MNFPEWNNLNRTEKMEIFRAIQAGERARPEYADSTAKVADWLTRTVKPLAWGTSILAAMLLVLVWFITFDRTFWLAYTLGWMLMASGLQFVMRRARKSHRLNRDVSNDDGSDGQDDSRATGITSSS